MNFVILGGGFIPVLVSREVNSISSLLFPHHGGVRTQNSSVDCNWIPGWSSWPASISSLVHPLVVGEFHWVFTVTTFVIVEVSTSAYITSVELVVFFDVMWKIDLNLLRSSFAIGVISKISLSTPKIVVSVHVVYFFNFFLEEIFMTLEQVSNVHWETDRSDSDRVVFRCFKNLYVSC